MKLKSDIINYGDKSIRIDYIKVRKGDGKVYVEVALVGKDAKKIDEKTEHKLTSRFYANKTHAQEIVLPVVKGQVYKLQRGTVEMDYDEVMKLQNDRKIIFVTSLGQENIYFQKGGLDFFVKSSKNFKRFETPKWITTNKLKEMI